MWKNNTLGGYIMQKPTIGVQMMMLKDKIAQDGIRETFRRVKEIGFSTVELSQIDMSPENVSAIKSSLEEFEMRVCATSAALKPMAPGITTNKPGNVSKKNVILPKIIPAIKSPIAQIKRAINPSFMLFL